MLRRKMIGIAAVAVALGIAVGTPVFVRAGLIFTADLHKTHAGNFTVGQNGTFTVAVSMASGANGTDRFSVTDSLPAGLNLVTATGSGWTCTNTGQVVTCGGATGLTSTQTAAFSVVVSVGSAASPSVTNTATLHDASQANNTTATTVASDPVTVQAASTSSTTTTTTTTSTTSSASAISAPPSGAGSSTPLWSVLLLTGGLGALLTSASLRRRR